MKLSYSIGTDEEVDRIHEMSVKILEEVGATFHSPETVELFKKHGAKVEDKIVYISRGMLESALKTVPKSYDHYNRNGGHVTVGGTGKTVYESVYGPIFVRTGDTIEKSNHEHFVNFHKLNETSDIIDISNPYALDAQYIPQDQRQQYSLGVTLKYCQKPLDGIVLGGKAVVSECLEAMFDFYGFKDKPVALGMACTAGPMQMATDMCEAIAVLSAANQPMLIVSGVTLGASGPQTMAGAYTIGNAMVLAGIVYTQLVRPGAPILYCTRFSGHDMRNMIPAYGGIEAMWACATTARMAGFYGFPFQTGVSNTESKALDLQAGAETFMNILSPHLLKADLLPMACGLLDAMNMAGYEKFIWDEECVKKCRHLMEGYEANDETFRFEEIKKKGTTGSYLGRVLPIYRKEFYEPKYDIRDIHNNWVTKGRPLSVDLLAPVWKKRLEEYIEPELDADRKIILKRLLPEEYHHII
ncbi:MAG: trimethylamine methyltransferase family protein [Deltaproteobacteria bacterium]|jgi:trimethylamine--corrinoid protein Co-methyltransferase|nr:trimethylamine methyltransferase family protein [Deltaproteobacteria bacterium]